MQYLKNIRREIKKLKNITISIYIVIKNIILYIIILFEISLNQRNISFSFNIFFLFIVHLLILILVTYYIMIKKTASYDTYSQFNIMNKYSLRRNLRHINPAFHYDIYKAIDEINMCHICQTYKPERAHHCRICHRCYFRFDSHSNLFNCCIHHYNYKYYVLFIFFNLLYSVVLTIIFLLFVRNLTTSFRDIIFLVFSILNIVTLFCFAYLFALYSFLVYNNETYVEYRAINTYLKGFASDAIFFQRGPIDDLLWSNNRKFLNIYNLGPKRNLQYIFGENIFDMFSVNFTTDGDGIEFPINNKNYK